MDTLFESAIRATFIAAATALVLRVMRVTAPAALHGVWSAVTVVMLLIIPDASRSLRWLAEGLAEYERGTWDARDLAGVRQTAAAGRIPAVDTLGDDDRQWGHAVFDFLGAEFGQDGIRRYLAALRRQPRLDAASETAFDIPLAEFNRRFIAHVMTSLARR